MSVLSDADIIAKNPIGNGLDAFRDLFRAKCKDLGISETRQLVENSDAKDLSLKLILALQTIPPTHALPSRIDSDSGTLLTDVFNLGSQIASDKFSIGSIIPLFEKIDSCASDLEIYNALFTLVTRPATPPRPLLYDQTFDTPVKSTSASQQGSEQTHEEVDARILQEINGCVFRGTKGFYEKYFQGKSWSPKVEEIIRGVKLKIKDGRWTQYPNPPTQEAFLKWFGKFQKEHLKGTRGTFETSCERPLPGSEAKRKPDLFLRSSQATKRDGQYNWTNVQVLGELKLSENPREFKRELSWFCGHAREVFKSQPTRRFLHGCFIRGSVVELWVVDRSGLYSGEKFDIHEKPDRFVRVMAGYALMDDMELGMNTHIKEDENGKYIMFKQENRTRRERLYLENKPIASQRAVVCRGTTCYRAKRNSKGWEFVVKFAWRSATRDAEGELLRLAKQRNVWGVAQLFGYQDLGSIAELRADMEFEKPMKFRLGKESQFSGSKSRTSGTASGLATSQHLPSSSSIGPNRKRPNDTPPTQARKTRLTNRHTRLNVAEHVDEQDDTSKEADRHSVEQQKRPSLTNLATRDDATFDDRILSCLVISPPGRPIDEFKSVKEFLEACRDVVKALRSLYQKGNIIHRDISVNNIIITDAEKDGEPKGMLIDLDLAKELNSAPSGARRRTGTMEFMAIEVLTNRSHTYRHDLESLFYVFLWVIILHSHKMGRQSISMLDDWYKGTYQQIADMKGRHMDKERFKDILDEFHPNFDAVKKLAEELRGILFPIRNESLFTGTYLESEKLYRPMIDAFERTMAELRKSS